MIPLIQRTAVLLGHLYPMRESAIRFEHRILVTERCQSLRFTHTPLPPEISTEKFQKGGRFLETQKLAFN